jgi:hypothetical protein
MDLRSIGRDWWTNGAASELMAAEFRKHLLGLMIEYKCEKITDVKVFTGFLLDHGEHLLWVSAGHAIDAIRSLCENDGYKVLRARWMDGLSLSGAESVPFDVCSTPMLSLNTAMDVDVGFAVLSDLATAAIRSNHAVSSFTSEIWRGRDLADIDGYYLIGYPAEDVEIETTPLGGGKVLRKLEVDCSCLPIARIEHRNLEHPFWSDPSAFYGRIVPFDGEGWHQPVSVSGMSGGPLLAVSRALDAEPQSIRYHLWGVQRSELTAERLVRCEDVDKLITIIEHLL